MEFYNDDSGGLSEILQMKAAFSFTGEKLEAQRGGRTGPSQPHSRAPAVPPLGPAPHWPVPLHSTSEQRRQTGRWPGRPRREKPGGSLAGSGCRKTPRTNLFLRLGTCNRSPCPSRCTAGVLLGPLKAKGCPQGRGPEMSNRDLPWPQAAMRVSLAAALGKRRAQGTRDK